MIFRNLVVSKMAGVVIGLMGSWQILTAPAKAQAVSPLKPVRSFQRSAEIYNLSMAATSGPKRGEEIYYFKCWMCHNNYTIKAGTPAPSLKGLFERSALITGEPVNDQTVAENIREGEGMMPAYRYALTDADIADLISYFRDKTCCYDAQEPPANPRYSAKSGSKLDFQIRNNLQGGSRGIVRSAAGNLLEGIMVQLVAKENGVRTTVYSNDQGQCEFPKLPTGLYTLRIARPLEFKPYQKDAVRIDGAIQLDAIVLDRVTKLEWLPATPEIMAQLVGADWLKNIPGTGQEKRVFTHECGFGCHSYQQVFRTRYDEHGWREIVNRMVSYRGSPLIMLFPKHGGDEESRESGGSGLRGRSGLPMSEVINILANWLGRVRGPESKDIPFDVIPGPRGKATRVIVTEYELPRLLLAPHDVCGDSKGNIWYTPHRSPYIGKLDPHTGVVTEYRIPTTPGALPGTHAVWIDQNDIVWISAVWAHQLLSFDPRTEKFTQVPAGRQGPYNTPGIGNFALTPDGFVWESAEGVVNKIDPKTGKSIKQYPLRKIRGTYDNFTSWDGNFWGGGQWPGNLVGMLDVRTGETLELETRSVLSSPAKGFFDREGNAWFGGRSGPLIKLDVKKRETKEYYPPTPYLTFYEAMTDKNGEVWAAALHGGRFERFNPRTEQWTEYVLPEPYSHDRRTWIDNSSDPVTVWYADHNGYIVRIQRVD